MNFFNKSAPYPVSLIEFNKQAKEELLNVCDFYERQRGRPSKNVLGETMPVQLTASVAVAVLEAVRIAVEKANGVLIDSAVGKFASPEATADHAKTLIQSLAKQNPNVKQAHPIDRLYHFLGELVAVGPDKDNPRLRTYVAKRGAKPAELWCQYDMIKAEARRRTKIADMKMEILENGTRAVVDVAGEGGFLQDAYTKSVLRFRLPKNDS